MIFQLLAFAIPAHALMKAIQVSTYFPHPRLFIHSGRRRSLVDVTAQSHATAFIKTSGHRLGDFLVRPSVRRTPPGSLMGERRKAPGGKRGEKGKRGRGGGAAGANSICQEKVFLFLPPHFLFRPVCLLHIGLGVAFTKRLVLTTFHKIYLGSSLANGGGGDGIRLLQVEGGGGGGGRAEASAHRGRRQRHASPAAAAAAARKTGGGGGKRGRQQGTSLSGVRDSGERTIERRISPHF